MTNPSATTLHVVFSHGKESGPAGDKILALAEVAERFGARVSSVDYRDLPDPDDRAERLRNFPFAPGERIVLVGSSMGSYVAAAASRAVRPEGLFLMAPAFYLPTYRDREPEPFARSVQVVHGWGDEVVPVELAIRWSRRFDVPCHLLPGDHSLTACIPALRRLFAAFLEGLASPA
jgi:alpha-beta hydrolase superfamily lysophospholipase